MSQGLLFAAKQASYGTQSGAGCPGMKVGQGKVPGSHQGETSGDHQATAVSDLAKMAPTCRLHGRNSQHWDNGGCPSSPHPSATQLSLLLDTSATSRVAVLLPEPTVSACKQVNLCTSPLRGSLVLQKPSVLPRQGDSLLIFTTRCCGDIFLALEPWAGELSVGLGPLSSGGTSTAKVSLLIFNHYMWKWGQPTAHLCPFYQS